MKFLSAATLVLLVCALGSPAFAFLSREVAFAPGESADAGIDAGINVDECAFPEPPVIPSGATAPESDLAAASAAVRDYQNAIQSSLDCIEGLIAELGEDITPEQDSGLTAIYNNGVEQLTMIAESFNQQVRAFRARQAKESEE